MSNGRLAGLGGDYCGPEMKAYEPRIVPIKERIQAERDQLAKRMAVLDEAIAALDENPGFEKMFNLWIKILNEDATPDQVEAFTKEFVSRSVMAHIPGA